MKTLLCCYWIEKQNYHRNKEQAHKYWNKRVCAISITNPLCYCYVESTANAACVCDSFDLWVYCSKQWSMKVVAARKRPLIQLCISYWVLNSMGIMNANLFTNKWEMAEHSVMYFFICDETFVNSEKNVSEERKSVALLWICDSIWEIFIAKSYWFVRSSCLSDAWWLKQIKTLWLYEKKNPPDMLKTNF